MSKGKGWHNNSFKHRLASKGISTDYVFKANGKPTLAITLPPYTRDKIKKLDEIAEGKEWIAELIILKGTIFIDDLQVSTIQDKSFLDWKTGDGDRDVGYIHYHPPGIRPEFSSMDFVLTARIHDMRKNKAQYPYTIMGVVYPLENNKLGVRIYGLNPNAKRLKQFEDLDKLNAGETEMSDIIKEMTSSKELVKMKEVVL